MARAPRVFRYLYKLMRFSDDILRGKKFVFVMGPGAATHDVKKSLKSEEVVVLCGYYAAPTYYNELDGYFVPGCPPQPEDSQRKIKEILMLSASSYAIALH